VRDELALLVRSLRRRIATTVANERRVESRAFIAELPAHFERVVDPLASLVAQIFVSSVYGETPTLRGIYFTSATQQGRAIDVALGDALRQSGIESRALAESTLEPRSYFVHQVITRIVLPDAETAAPSERARRRRNVLHLSTGIATATVASALLLATAISWQANRRAIDALSGVVHRLPREHALLAPGSLDPLRAQLMSLDERLEQGPPLSMRFGLYGGAHLRLVARERYLAAIRDHVLAPLLGAEATELASWGAVFETDLDREPDEAQRGRALTLLERQLRFAAPAEPHEPPLDAQGRDRQALSLADAWCASLARPASACLPHATLLFSITSEPDRPRTARHDAAIRLARLGLSRTDSDRAALDALVAATSGRGFDLTLARMVGTTGRALTTDLHVRGAFTRRGWEEVVRAQLDAADGDASRAWALGDTATQSTPASREALRVAYFEAYAEEWRAFLASIRVTSPADSTESLALLEDLTRGTPAPIGRLLSAIDDNAHLAEAPQSETRAVATSLLDSLTTHLTSARPEIAALHVQPDAPSSIVARALDPYTRFAVRSDGMPEDAPLGVEVYEGELALLRDAVATYRDDPTAAAALEARLVAARRRVDGLVTEQAPACRDFFERVLRPPVEAAAVTSSRAMATSVANAFCAAVVTPFSASLSGRYPFASQGDDAPLGEVAAFYRPGGTLWSYYDASLATIAPRAGSRFTLARRLDQGGASPYSNQLPAFLDRSQTITNGLFPPGSIDPRIELDVRVHPTAGAASVRFSVGGATIDYRNGPETWSRIVWPGATPTTGARLEVESARGLSERITRDGEWGLFRLIEAAAQIEGRVGERTRTARWHLPGHDVDVVIDLRPVRTECPLFADGRGRALGPLRASGVSAPRHIARGGSECAP
jgi:type VI secretion system protein ImpL